MNLIKESDVCVTAVTKFRKKITICGFVIDESFEWMDEADGTLTAKYVLENVVPHHATYTIGRVSNTNEFGYVVPGSTSITLMDTDAEPAHFHPGFRAIISSGSIQFSKIGG